MWLPARSKELRERLQSQVLPQFIPVRIKIRRVSNHDSACSLQRYPAIICNRPQNRRVCNYRKQILTLIMSAANKIRLQDNGHSWLNYMAQRIPSVCVQVPRIQPWQAEKFSDSVIGYVRLLLQKAFKGILGVGGRRVKRTSAGITHALRSECCHFDAHTLDLQSLFKRGVVKL